MSENFDFSNIAKISVYLRRCLAIEHEKMLDLTFARSAYESEKLRVIAQAVKDGKIDMKNADTRKTGESEAVENSSGCYWLEKYLFEAQVEYGLAEIDRKTIETEISLTKAWLYSQSGVGK